MRSFLAACRRIFLAVLAVLILLGGWFYWQAPSLNTLRPELEHLLAAQLGLKELHLGRLSWRWAGYTWVDADSITFVGAEQRIRVKDARLEVRLSTWDLIRGRIQPTSISLRHGRIVLHIPKAASHEAFPVPTGVLRIEDSSVTLDYGAFSNRFEHLNLLLDADHRTLGMQLPGFTLDVAWNVQLQPEYVHVQFDNLHWIPERWRPDVQGAFSAKLQLDMGSDNKGWDLAADIKSSSGATIRGGGRTLFVVNQLQARAHIHSVANPLDVTAIDWQRLVWQGGKNRIEAKGRWVDGQLQLQLRSPMLQIPVLAGWGMPLANHGWREWLTGLSGTLKQTRVTLHLRQASPWGLPQLTKLQPGDVLVSSDLSNASIPLVGSGQAFRELNGSLSLGLKGLDMQVSSVQLPGQAGVVHGDMHIADLADPVFELRGRGTVDVGQCERWLHVNALPQVEWGTSPADARFALSWPMMKPLPDKGTANLVPQPAWQADIMQQPVTLRGGSMHWAAGKGLTIKGMSISDGNMQGKLALAVRMGAAGVWQMTGLHIASAGDFAWLAKRLQMPLDGASGRYGLRVDFDIAQQEMPWQFTLDCKDAAWTKFLGSKKRQGQLYLLQAVGKQSGEKIQIVRITSIGVAPMIGGSGVITRQLASLQIDTLHTPAFSGSVAFRMPLGKGASNAPLEIDIHSDFLDQSALPRQIPKALGMPGKGTSNEPTAPHANWVLRGYFKRVRWDAVAMRGVQVYFASSTQGIGRLQADQLDAAQFSIYKVRTYFRLLSGGHMDIRHMEATFLGQHINLSGILGPDPGGGLRWAGFADVNGDFSQIIHRLDAAKLFKGGTLHAHWSGSGVISKNKPWWNDMRGRLRMRSDNGRILEGGTMTKLLAALNLADLPKFLTGERKDITGPGMLYKRLQLEATVQGEKADIRKLAMRASALDMGGKGSINLSNGSIDLYVVAHPLQNIDALLNMIPLLRDVIMGPARSLFRKIYHVHGSLYDAKVEPVSAKQAGLPGPGLVEQLINLPGNWFDAGRKAAKRVAPHGF